MLQKEYEKLVEYLEEMIADGCQLVHGGNLLDWHDTKILKVLQKIKTLRERETSDARKIKKEDRHNQRPNRTVAPRGRGATSG